jgi:signal peptidase I
MSETHRLNFGEFIGDIRSVITSPRERFQIIQERGVFWSSLVLLVLPVYFAFFWAGGVFWDHSPFPGYTLLMPAVFALGTALLKALFIHLFACLFEGRGHFSAARGTYRQLLVVFGYTTVPAILAALSVVAVISLVPRQLGALVRDIPAVTTSIIVSLGLALFIWNLILTVLGLRTVYRMHDGKIVLSFLLGSVLVAASAMALSLAVVPIHVDYIYIRPLLAPRMEHFFAADPAIKLDKGAPVGVHVDMIAYQLKQPRRFDVALYSTDFKKNAEEKRTSPIPKPLWRFVKPHAERAIGRIVGLPGDSVELVGGKLKINGRLWSEPYLAAEFQSNTSLPLRHLGGQEYLIMPEDRQLLKSQQGDWVVPGDSIIGRVILVKWPLGWFIFRRNIFLQPQPVE